MTTVLRKNKAWLHDLVKRHLPEVVPSLFNKGILLEKAKEAALLENVDASTRTMELLTVIEEEMSDSVEPCTVGLLFIHVLIDLGIDDSGNLEKTANEFREEQRKESRRSSVASTTGCLDSSSSSVFIDTPSERENEKRRGSMDSTDSGRRSRRSSSERKLSDPSIPSQPNSESSGYLPQRSKSVSHVQNYKSDERNCEEGHHLSSIPETAVPDSPNLSTKFEGVASPPNDSPLALVSAESQTRIEPVDEVFPRHSDYVLLNDDQFADELQHCVRAVEPVPCHEDADRARYQDEQLAMKNELQKLRQYCDNQVSLCEAEKQQLESDKQKEIQQLKKETSKKLNDKEQQLEVTKSQVAELERKNHLLQEKMKMAETDCVELHKKFAELHKKLAEKENYITSLQETFERNCEKVEELTGGASDPLQSSDRRCGQWQEIKRLLNQLSERKELLMQTKMAILKKVEIIKTNKKRPYTV